MEKIDFTGVEQTMLTTLYLRACGLEEVMLARDESASMVWGIEQTVRMPTGEPRPAAETLAFRRRLRPVTPPGDPRAPVAYR
ncbi:hypothetical protein SAMN05444920_109104 [Nonomuraea solani]|uniref:Uncharacterized protein n=2 Tax=Nonomuraea solani TaxID=1144553 RepID=A0A1H6ECU0_9ACTN|nr:hypothetical protein SAMN05444920_109104 [Nonomuraea solani]